MQQSKYLLLQAGLSIILGLSVAALLIGNMYSLPIVVIFVGILAAALYFRQPTFFLYLITVYLFFGDYILNKLGIYLPQFGFLDEALAFGVLILFLAQRWVKHEKSQISWLPNYTLGLLGVILVSAFVNQVDTVLTFNFASTLFKPIILFYIIIESNFSEGQLYNLLKFVIGIGVVQGLIVLQQYGLGLLSGAGTMDVATGTLGFGLQHHVGYLLLILAIIVGSIFINERKQWQFMLASIFAIGFFITNALHALLLLPVVILLLFVSIGRKISTKARIVAFMLIPISFVIIMSLAGEEKIANTFEPETLLQTGKLISYQTLITELPKELSFPGMIFGAGPGMYASEVAVKNRSTLFMKYVFPITANMPDDAKSSTMNFPWTSIIAMLGELGPFGLLLYSLLLLKIYRELRKVYWGFSTPPFWKGLAFGTMGAIIFMWLMAFIMTAFEDMFMTYPVFIISGVIIAWSRTKLIFDS